MNNCIVSNGYHVPTDSIFYANVGQDACIVMLADSPVQLSFQIPAEEVRPVLEKAGFLSFGVISINPKNISFVREVGVDAAVYGSFDRSVHVVGKESIDRILEALSPKKRVK